MTLSFKMSTGPVPENGMNIDLDVVKYSDFDFSIKEIHID